MNAGPVNTVWTALPVTGTIRVWDAADGAAIHTLTGHKREVTGVAFSPNGQNVFAGGFDRTVMVLEASNGHRNWTSPTLEQPVAGVQPGDLIEARSEF